MSWIPFADDVLAPDTEVITLSAVAKAFGVPSSRVQQMARDGQLLVIRRDGQPCVPAELLDGDVLIKGLTGTLTVLSDSGFSKTEALRWLFTPDDTLPGRPIDALRGNRGTEVKRRAQAMAF